MKGIEILCASQAATAIRSMMEEGSSSSSSSSTIYLGRAIDRYNPIIRDSTRTTPKTTFPPCSSNNQPPISPKSRNNNQKDIITAATTTRKAGIKGSSSSSSSSSLSSSSKRNSFEQKRKKTSVIINNNNNNDPGDKKSSSSSSNNNTKKKGGWGCTNPGDFISPPGSTRYLLSSDRASSSSFDALSNFDPILNLPRSLKKQQQQQSSSSSSSVQLPVPPPPPPPSSSSSVQLPVPPPPPSSSSSSPSTPDQVVVLRVSLHCKGCERKMRKHISRMEGVTSFNIDFAAKKVTVIGDVTPLSVLASVSKVKNAQLLAPTISPLAPPVASVPSEIQKFNAVVV